MTDKLTEICDTTRAEVARRKAASSLADLAARAATQSAPRGFEAALRARAASGFALMPKSRRPAHPRA
jgi:indole-3-glycerol phosphate synthase